MLQLTLTGPASMKFGVLRFDGVLPPGLLVEPSFISAAEERALLDAIDSSDAWRDDLSRRVQHYGFRYDYKARALSLADKIDELPGWLTRFNERLVEHGYFGHEPDQVIINEYRPGQGISAHVDREACFGSTVASLSLESDTVMEFSSSRGERSAVLLERRSLVVLSGDARYEWMHSIPARKRDRIGDTEIQRKRRVSLTFRTVILS